LQNTKCALVTGAVRNTGLAAAEKFLQEGWTVIITSRSAGEAEEKAAELTEKYGRPCYGYQYTPLTAEESCEELFSKIDSLGLTVDAVVCCAADLGLNQDALTVDIKTWTNVVTTNVIGYFAPARAAALRLIEAKKPGTVVFIGSINCRDAIPHRSAYVASKGAIRSMTKGLALDFAPYGIRVNCIMPGPIWTTRYDADPEKAARKASVVPLGRVSQASEIANAIYFFSTDASGNATGSGLVIDGGLDSVVAGGY